METIYKADYVRALFNEMSKTYGLVNYIASFGFCKRWREQCVKLVAIQPGMDVYDLMTGMGECWPMINRRLDNAGRLVGLDFSEAMCQQAAAQKSRLPHLDVAVVQEDMLHNTLPDASADCVISAFGLKTFSDTQKETLAREIARILRPGGLFSLLEISVPSSALLRIPYLFYIKHVIPLIGKLLLGNPDNYRMLGIYTEKFKDCNTMKRLLHQQGLAVTQKVFFFGCASAVYGKKIA